MNYSGKRLIEVGRGRHRALLDRACRWQRGWVGDAGAEEDVPMMPSRGGSQGGGGRACDVSVTWAGGQAGQSWG
jgi:hypothetical protein